MQLWSKESNLGFSLVKEVCTGGSENEINCYLLLLRWPDEAAQGHGGRSSEA